MTELKSMLLELAQEAKTYDVVDRAQQRARRRRWLRPASACAAVVVAATGTVAAVDLYHSGAAQLDAKGPTTQPTVPAPPIPGSCTAARLPVPAGWPPKSIVSGGDRTGRYIIGRGYPSITDPNMPTYGALLWDNGVVIRLEVPGAEVVPADVNSSGQVVVTSWQSGGTVGYSYANGVLTRLAGDGVQVSAVNERGEIVGSVTAGRAVDPGLPTGRTRPAVWMSSGAQPEMLGPDDLTGTAVGIDEDGTVLVQAQPPTQTAVAATIYRFGPDRTMTRVPMPAGAAFSPAQLRGYDDGWVVGAGEGGRAPYFVWHIGTGEWHQLPALADAVNPYGWVPVSLDPIPKIGEAFSPAGTAFLTTTGGMRVELPPLTGKYGGYALLPVYVSDDGRTVAGQAIDPTYESRDADDLAVVWHCG